MTKLFILCFLVIPVVIGFVLYKWGEKIICWFLDDINVPVENDDDWSEADRLLDITKEGFHR